MVIIINQKGEYMKFFSREMVFEHLVECETCGSEFDPKDTRRPHGAWTCPACHRAEMRAKEAEKASSVLAFQRQLAK